MTGRALIFPETSKHEYAAGLQDEEAEYTTRMRKADRQQANTRVGPTSPSLLCEVAHRRHIALLQLHLREECSSLPKQNKPHKTPMPPFGSRLHHLLLQALLKLSLSSSISWLAL